jgi:elongation factor G
MLYILLDNYLWHGGAAFGSLCRAHQKGVQGIELLQREDISQGFSYQTKCINLFLYYGQVDATTGKPRVNFRETVTQRANFDYLHKKQSGGQGQYGRVTGYIEPLPEGSSTKFEFENLIIGQAIPSNFIPAIEKGFREAANSGSLIGHPVENVRVVLTDGASHAVDSSELAFKLAAIYALRQVFVLISTSLLKYLLVVCL